jgi:RNA polymerase sigma factor (sigma-70 family)
VAQREALVERAIKGDAGAIDLLLRERRPDVVRYAMRLCISPADAEEATQETLLALSRYIGRLREVAALSSWLFRAVRTHCTRLARSSLRHVLMDDTEPISLEGPNPEEQLADRRLRERLALVLEGLPAELREVLVHRDILGESTNDTAALLGLTVPAMKSRLLRARAAVKEELLRSLQVR